MTDEALREEIAAFYHGYMQAFRRGDAAALGRMAVVPMARIGAGTVEMVATPPDPAALKARTGWHDTVEIDFVVLDATPDKAHVHLRRALRVRADGSAIEAISGVYVLVRQADGWRILAISVLVTPP